MPFPLEDGKHVHYFDVCDTPAAKRAFEEKVKELLSKSPEEKGEFRLRAWRHALQYSKHFLFDTVYQIFTRLCE